MQTGLIIILFVSLVAPASPSADMLSAGMNEFETSYNVYEQFTECTPSRLSMNEFDRVPLATHRLSRDAFDQTPGQVPEKTSTAGPVMYTQLSC